MIKRLNKVTSLAVAAAAVASLVPATGAMAADYKRIQSEDGTVNGAVAYKDGKYFVDGELEDKDEAAYYVSGGKYTDLDDSDISSGDYDSDEDSLYADKYIEFDTDLYLDLETGKVSDDEIRADNKDDAASTLRKKFRKDADKDSSYTNVDELPELKEVAGNKFAGLYYENDEAKSNTYYGNKVYTDANGKYVMADYSLGKIKVNNETVKDIEDDGVKSISHVKTLGQDENYIYRIAELTFTTADSVNLGNDIVTTDASIKVIQKISKAQGSDDFEGAILPKSVSTYYLVDDEPAVKGTKNAKEVNFDDYEHYTISNGKITGYNYDDNKLEAKTITLSTKKGLYYTDLSDGISETEVDAVDTDVNGNIFFLKDGYVMKYDLDEDFDKIYKVDGSMDNLSVYDQNNMILWSEDDDVYSVISGKSSTTEEDKEEETTTTGWVQNADGTWNYLNAEGNKVTGWLQSPASGLWYYMDANGVMMSNGWVQDGGNWYLLNADGSMATGWKYTGGAWYYLKPTAGNRGAMQTGWINDNGTWYYCNASGAMLSNTTVGGYVLGANGAWIR